MDEPTNGVDYLVDYYATLGVEGGATSEEVATAWRTKVKQWHPDKLHGMAPELIIRATSKTELLNEAYEVLSNEKRRLRFDATLQNWTKPISYDGRQIIEFGASGFSFSKLVGGIQADSTEAEANAEKLALQFSNYSPATYEMFQEMAASSQGIPEKRKAAYLEQLEIRELYLSLKEGFIWDSVGNHNHVTTPTLNYLEQISDDLNQVRKQAFAEIGEQVLRLATGEHALLAPPDKQSGEINVPALITAYEGKIGDYLDQQAAKLTVLAKEKQVILNTRFNLASAITYHPDCTSMTALLVIEIKGNSKSGFMCFELDDNENATGLEVNGLDELSDPQNVKEWLARGFTFVSFNNVPDIDLKDQLVEVLTRHGAKLRT